MAQAHKIDQRSADRHQADQQQAELIGGTVLRALPQGLYRVSCDDGREVTAGLDTKARRTTVRVIPGDRVSVEISPLDPSRGRIRARY